VCSFVAGKDELLVFGVLNRKYYIIYIYMKKIGLFVTAVCVSLVSLAQNTVDIYSTGALGSFTTGYASSTTRNDNSMVVTGTTAPQRRGYAVFDLSSIPATAVITSVETHFNVELYSPGFGAGSTTRGYAGDLSLITVPGTLYTTMGLATTIYSAAYTNGLGNQFLASDPLAVAFMGANIGSKVSVIWTVPTASRVFTITGETGAASTSGIHAPFVRITYDCPGITSITATGPATPPCPNIAFGLTGSATGSVSSYLWSGPVGFTSTMASPTVSTGLPSTGTYTLAVTDAAGCTSKTTVSVPVSPAPTTVISPLTPTAFCAGDNCTLDATAVPGNIYQWYDGGVAIPGATDASYVSDTSGNYQVEITDINGCTDITAASTPTVLLDNPGVLPGDTILLCLGDNGTLTVNTNGVTSGLAFQWQKNGVNIGGAISNSYLATTTGIYKCLVSVPSTTCSTTSKDIYVNVNSYPIPVVTFSGTTLSTAGVFSYYQWFLNTIAVVGATSSTYMPTSPGSYRVRVTDANGCTAFSGGYAVNTTGISEVGQGEIAIFPNPVTDVLNIVAPFSVNAIITGIEGKVIGNYSGASSISLQSYPAGIYIVTIFNEAGERIRMEKVTKQ
jgi:hypothetical protein